MASRIQGITVEIGGDTTKLSKALESVNKSIKGTQSGLKDVNKLLKLDPSNTELVVQKQKMLKDAIEATKEKLATLKTAAQQANEQLANGEITQQQYDALQREIVETEQNLRSLQDQAATTNATLAKIDEAGEKLQNIGSSVENVGKKFLPVTAAVTGLGTAAVKTAADFDSEMSKVSAISGATGDDFDQLRAKAREMGAKTKFSASEAASAMEYMAMAGWKTSDMLNGIEGVMNLAAASGEDLATTSDIVTDTVHVYISKLGIEVSSKVTETEYDALLERYNSITLSNSTVSSRNSSLTGSLNSIRNTATIAYDTAVRAETAVGEQVGGITASIIYDGALFAALFGLHYKNETDSKGNTTRYAFNAATLKQSTVAWKNSSAGLFVSTDGGKTWSYGWESDDTAVRTAILLEQTLKELDDRYKKATELSEELLKELDERYKTATAISAELQKTLDQRYETAKKLSIELYEELDKRYGTLTEDWNS